MALIHRREKSILIDVLDSLEIMSEEELHRPSDQTDFKPRWR